MRKPDNKDEDSILEEMKKMYQLRMKEQQALKNLLEALKRNSPVAKIRKK